MAVLVKRIGLPSETFIRNHIDLLAPGETTVIAQQEPYEGEGSWSTTAPSRTLPPLRRAHIALSRVVPGMELLRSGPTNPWTSKRAMRRYMEHFRPEVVLAQYLDKWVDYIEPIKRSGARLFAHAHGYDASQRLLDQYWVRRYAEWNNAQGVIVVSDHMKRRLVDVGIDAAKLHKIPCGVSVPKKLARRTPDPNGVTRCLAIGRMVGKKAPLRTLDAFYRAWRHRNGRMRLDYVGAGPLYPDVARVVEARGLATAVTLWGPQPHTKVRELLERADIYVQHSITDPETGDEEGMPVAIMEAMAAGLPVVSTRHAGIPEAVTHNTTGLLVNEGDVEGMAVALFELADRPDKRAEMGYAGWRRAQAEFTIEKECNELLDLLEPSA